MGYHGIKDEILCKKEIRAEGTGADYLFIIPVSLRKEIFKHLHEYITGGHLGRSKTYDKLKRRVSKKGHKYLMVVSDYFTKWVDAIPLKIGRPPILQKKTSR